MRNSLGNSFSKKENKFKNVFENICFIQADFYPSFYIGSNSVGMISNSVFENSQTGGISIIDSNVTIVSTKFRNNIINSSNLLNYNLYPNIRFNIFVDGNSLLIVNDIETDTPGSYWIHNKGIGIMEGESNIISSPLFIPTVESVVVREGINIDVSFIVISIVGKMLYPCNLVANFIINNDWNTAQETGFDIGGLNENESTVNIPTDLLKKTGDYYIYISYGVNNSLNTQTVWFYNVQDNGNDGSKGSENNDDNKSYVVIVIVVVLAAVAILVVIIIIFIIYKRKNKKNNIIDDEVRSDEVDSDVNEEDNGDYKNNNVEMSKNKSKIKKLLKVRRDFSKSKYLEGNSEITAFDNKNNNENEINNFAVDIYDSVNNHDNILLHDPDNVNCFFFFFLYI
jgi:hypothetical protein